MSTERKCKIISKRSGSGRGCWRTSAIFQRFRHGLLVELVNVHLKWAKPVRKASVFGVHFARFFKNDPAEVLAVNRVWQSAEAHMNSRPFFLTRQHVNSIARFANEPLDSAGVGAYFILHKFRRAGSGDI